MGPQGLPFIFYCLLTRLDIQDQLSSAPPVQNTRGRALLMKMGWKPGEGIGKDGQGTLEPLMLDVKSDRKGE